MGQEKDRLLRLIDMLSPEPEARDRYVQGTAGLSEEEAARVADEIDAIINATPEGQAAFKAFIAGIQATPLKKPPS